MESLLGTMSGVAIFFGIGYLLLTVFIIIYFFRMASDVKSLKESLDSIKKVLIKQDWINNKENNNVNSDTINLPNGKERKTEYSEIYTTNKYGVVGDAEIKKNKEALDRLIAKMNKNQCVIRVLSSSTMEIWEKADWVNVQTKKNDNKYQILFENFD